MNKRLIASVALLFIFPGVLLGCSQAANPSTRVSETAPPPTSGGLPLTVLAPADGATINSDSVLVRGKTEGGASVSVNSEVVAADSSGAFTADVTLGEGLNAIEVIATAKDKRQADATLMVNATGSSSPAGNAAALTVNITEPADSASIPADRVTVKGSTQPGATVIVNGIADVADDSGNFAITVPLESGLNAIDIVAVAEGGNQTEVLLMVNDTGG